MKKMWVVIYSDDDIIECVDIFDDYLKGVGATYTRFLDTLEEFKDDGYEVVKTYEFNELECNTGYSWVAKIKRKRKDAPNYSFTFTYYLLKKEQEGDDE